MIRKALLMFAAVAVCFVPSCGDSGSGGQDVTSYASVQTQLQNLVNEKATSAGYPVPGIMLAVKNRGFQTMVVTSGVSDLTNASAADHEPGAPLGGKHRVRVGSISKTFTGIVVLQLIDEGKLALDDILADVMPDLVAKLSNYDTDQITIRMLLNHTSGIETFTIPTDHIFQDTYADPTIVWSHDDILQVVNSHSQLFPPGTAWHYSNTNFYILGMMIEKLTGNTYESEVKTRIVDALGLTDTEIPPPGDTSMSTPYAHGYSDVYNTGTLMDYTASDPSYPWSSGSVVSTVEDLVVWITAIYDGTLISPEMRKAQREFVDLTPFGDTNFGYGLAIAVEHDHDIFGHRGQIWGYDCTIQFVMGKDTAMAACVNRSMFDLGVESNVNVLVLYDALAVLWPDEFEPVAEAAGEVSTAGFNSLRLF